MRIAFYAPLKPPDHPIASGDRAMANALIAALGRPGHEVELASRFRSFDGGDPERQARIRATGARLAERLLRRFDQEDRRPQLWFTYHLYHKAPDWLGPMIADRLGIPYVLAEASFAPKQAGGKWDIGHRAVADAIGRADRIFQLNPADAECVLPLIAAPDRQVPLPPFLDTAAYRGRDRAASRAATARTLNLDPAQPWLLTVAMMRDDQKLMSYRVLADALAKLTDLPWQIVIAGSGPAEEIVRRFFQPISDRVRWAGTASEDSLQNLYRAADLYTWPAVKEAFGMALLEAQAAGLPAIVGRSGGVAAIVADGETGMLTPEGDVSALRDAVRQLLTEASRRKEMSEAAMRRTAERNDIAVAAEILDKHLRALADAA